MLRLRATNDRSFKIDAQIEGPSVFLDHFAMIRLAREDSARRAKFVKTIQDGGDLIFSLTNAVELTQVKGETYDRLKEFLNLLGPRWYPIEMDAKEVSNREVDGKTKADAYLSEKFVRHFCEDRMIDQMRPSAKIFSADNFFDLGWIMDWLSYQDVAEGKAKLDSELRARVLAHRKQYENDPTYLDRKFPAIPYDPRVSATFAYTHTMRLLIEEAKGHHLTENDGIDFCNAILGSSLASVATLDKAWKRRVELIPQPHGLARIYYAPELDEMVDDLEARVQAHKAS